MIKKNKIFINILNIIFARLAQMVERMTLNHVVVGSIPTMGEIIINFFLFQIIFLRR